MASNLLLVVFMASLSLAYGSQLAYLFTGVDTNPQQFSCAKAAGKSATTAAVQVFSDIDIGDADPSDPNYCGYFLQSSFSSVQNAQAAGFKSVDVVISTSNKHCESTSAASDIFAELFYRLNQNNKNPQINNTRVWLQVRYNYDEPSWLKPDANVQFIRTFVDEAKKQNKVLGIKTNSDWWQDVTKGSTAFSSLPLWNDDSNPWAFIFGEGSLPDGVYHPYGGWTKPTVRTPAGQSGIPCKGSQFVLYDLA